MPSNFKRPAGVMLLAILFLWIGGFGTLFFPVIALTGSVSDLVKLWPGFAHHSQSALRLISYSLGTAWYLCYVAYLVIGIGLLRLKDWARKSVVGISLFGMAASVVVGFVFVGPLALSWAAALGCFFPFGWQVFYLMRPRVRYAFGAWRKYTPAGQWIEPPGLSKPGKIAVGAAVPLTTLGFFIPLAMLAASSMIRSSGAYRVSMDAANASPCVASAIGTPLKTGWMLMGSMEESSQEGTAVLNVPVEGPKGKGDLFVGAKKSDGRWEIESLVLLQGSRRTQIVPNGPGCQ